METLLENIFPLFYWVNWCEANSKTEFIVLLFFPAGSLCQRERKINGCEMGKSTEDAQVFIVY